MVLTGPGSTLSVCTLPPPQKQQTDSSYLKEGFNERMNSKVTLQESLLIQQVRLLAAAMTSAAVGHLSFLQVTWC